MCKRFKCTVNDFAMSIFCQAVNEFIFEFVCEKEESKYEKITKQYGKRLYFRFFTVFNMRSLIETDLDRLENEISTVPIRLPCGRMTFGERLNEIHDSFYRLK